ncbi:c-type cytochrome [Massilia sp. P8910]|uniref:c-type cytochrome n=1 Tax=Massilia antarctica TaxID=2765360 RepID=UPI001E419DD5|nr:c-type cytochrome [Massilia antarctica]MCE3605791.1 c-type cytochrome [Massilia antarctica]
MKLLAYCLLAMAIPCASALAGDAVIGQKVYAARCIACHTIDASVAGPAHRGVVGRKAGSVAGFDYSPALKTSKVVWNEKNLDRWLSNPEKFIPGQRMFFSVSDPTERADLIAYLKTQHK